MKLVRSLLQAGVLGGALVTAGCMGNVIPGPDTADMSCVLLCALQREFMGEPASVSPVMAAPAMAGPRKHAVVRPRMVRKIRAVPPGRPARQARRRPATEVSVAPRSSPEVRRAAPDAMVPTSPAPVAIVPAPAALQTRSLSQAIPGSAGIVMPMWQAQ